MNFFNKLEMIIQMQNPLDKITHFKTLQQHYQAQTIDLSSHHSPPKHFTTPSFASICTIVDATSIPKRTALSTIEGKARLIHAIAHIEYSAIDLALDHSYRFRDMPYTFYDDWLEVADDEIRHFLLLTTLLEKYGYHYGDFPVHAFLFDVSQKSLDLLTRMAVVPRHLEASGLDANPQMIAKLSHFEDDFAKESIEVLQTILKEEVSHVKKGDYWFKWACKKEGVNPKSYFDIVEKVLPGSKKKKTFINIKARQQAGFSCDELRIISDAPCQED